MCLFGVKNQEYLRPQTSILVSKTDFQPKISNGNILPSAAPTLNRHRILHCCIHFYFSFYFEETNWDRDFANVGHFDPLLR